jgi:predicted transcriptional regulator
MWTANIYKKDFSNGAYRVHVAYTDGTNKSDEVYSLANLLTLEGTVRNRLAQLNALATLITTIPTGPYTPPSSTPPTAYELAKTEVVRVQELVDLGVLTEQDQEYINAINALKTEYSKL